jgi:hypothetical protein
MPGKGTKYDVLAREMADRIEAAQAAGEQLSLLPDETPDRGRAGGVGEGSPSPRGPGKALNQMREFLASRGLRMPEDVLAEMAGLASSSDAFVTAMMRTEQLLAWAGQGAVQTFYDAKRGRKVAVVDPVTQEPLPHEFAPEDRLEAFGKLFAVQLRAAEAMMPYGMPKITPDVKVDQVVQVVVPAGSGRNARDVTPVQRPQLNAMMPADMAWDIQQKQQVTEGENGDVERGVRSDDASD